MFSENLESSWGRSVVLLCTLLGLFACSKRGGDFEGGLKNHNLIIIVVDALRADHLGCYGYARNTSPFLDDLANESIVFEKALANSSYTRESISCLFSGRLPSSSGSYGYGAVPADPNKNLGELFRRAGYKTGFLSTTVVLTDRAFTAGFDHVDHLVTEWSASGMSSRLSEKALEFVQETEGRKFMLYLHYLDPHAPYDPPEALYLRYADAT
jgi:membrane-anchored protein YejM (alkaline phosphatase superfamily)